MAVFYKYEYTRIMKNIHPCLGQNSRPGESDPYDPRDACPNLDPEHVINRECETFVSPNVTLLGHLGYM